MPFKHADRRDQHKRKITRRKFIAGVGAGAGAAGLAATQPQAFAEITATASRPGGSSANFGRIFRLPAFVEPSDRVQRALLEMGAAGGPLDAKDPLQEGPIRLITVPALSPNNLDNPAQTAGVTFVGQFLDHDVTFDTVSQLGVPRSPQRTRNTRTPSLDLDSVYGRGPTSDPQFYDPADRAKFVVASGGQFEDLPRLADGTAIISDPRNDENMMISGLQVSFFKFHNNVVDALRADNPRLTTEQAFSEARRLVRWHYQWMVVHEFLPTIIGQPLVDRILARGGRQFYRPEEGGQYMPVEFQTGAYRFGHSMVRPSYRANLAGMDGQPFFGFIFDPSQEGSADPDDLRGNARAARRFIGWQTFFDFGGDQTQHVRPNKRIDTNISTPLFNLPLRAIASGDPPTSLPQRNLLRHVTWSMPSGQRIAKSMGITPLGPDSFAELRTFGVGLEASTPLWYYVLREADLLADGRRLAGVGARIVGEVFIGLLQLDARSYLRADPRWRPTFGQTAGQFGMTDLFRFAKVDPASRNQ